LYTISNLLADIRHPTDTTIIIVQLFQLLLKLMPNCLEYQLSVKTWSFHNGEMFLPTSNTCFVNSSMRSYVLLALRQVWLWYDVLTALLCTSSACLCWLSLVCVSSGGLEISEKLFDYSSFSWKV